MPHDPMPNEDLVPIVVVKMNRWLQDAYCAASFFTSSAGDTEKLQQDHANSMQIISGLDVEQLEEEVKEAPPSRSNNPNYGRKRSLSVT